MGNPIKLGLAGIGIVACLFFTVAMLWAELGMPSEFDYPHTIKLLRAEAVTTSMVEGYNGLFKRSTETYLTGKKAEGPLGDYVYAAMIALAFFGGAVAIMAVGSEDETEKTIVPAKK
ncbi:MAG TPA: hypothetical protein PKC98_22975 [Candidatus Melainabacteria bacterium]|nr:hypothetical protein [Candidatus Melainabacteria bacterium]